MEDTQIPPLQAINGCLSWKMGGGGIEREVAGVHCI